MLIYYKLEKTCKIILAIKTRHLCCLQCMKILRNSSATVCIIAKKNVWFGHLSFTQYTIRNAKAELLI